MTPANTPESCRVSSSELRQLLAAAKGMTEGDFRHLVKVKAEGEIAELAHYINLTLQNLQQLDPHVRDSSVKIPTVTMQLSDVILATENATNLVLDHTEQLLDEQEQIGRLLALLLTRLREGSSAPEVSDAVEHVVGLNQEAQGRAMEIMAAMEFQDVTSQRIALVVRMVKEMEERLLRLLVLFRLEGAGKASEGAGQAFIERLADSMAAAGDRQVWVDQILSEFNRSLPGPDGSPARIA